MCNARVVVMPCHAFSLYIISRQRKKITNHLIGGRLVIKPPPNNYIQRHSGDDNGRIGSRLSYPLWTLAPMMFTIRCRIYLHFPCRAFGRRFPHFGEIIFGLHFSSGGNIGFGPRNQWLRLGFLIFLWLVFHASIKEDLGRLGYEIVI
jgi:hypothetical protein